MAARYNKEGYGQPLVWLYDGKGKRLADQRGRRLSEFITNFTYEYNEEDDDKCQIEIQTDYTKLPDHPALQIDSALFVRWGYITRDGSIRGPKRQIAIRDHSCEYGDNKIVFRLECTDAVSYLKEMQFNEVRKLNFIDWLSEVAKDKFRAGIEIHSNSTVVKNDTRTALQDTQYGDISVSVDNTAAPEQFQFFQQRIIKGQSKAIHKAIEDELKFAQGGPYFIDGRDDKITIHNRNFKQKAANNFRYAGERGDVISFKPRTNIKSNDTEIAKVATINPETKEVNYTTSNFIDLSESITGPNTGAYNPLIPAGPIVQAAKDEMFERMATGNQESIDGNQINDAVPKFSDGIHESYTFTETAFDVENYEVDLEDGDITVARDETRNPISVTYGINVDITAKEIIAQEGFQDELEIMLQNDVMEKKHRRIECRLTVIGNPYIESSKMFNISGVASVHAGKWYNVKVLHKISPQNGFTTEIEGIREPIIIAVEGKYTSKLKAALNELADSAEGQSPGKVETEPSIEVTDTQLFPTNQVTSDENGIQGENVEGNSDGNLQIDVQEPTTNENFNTVDSNLDLPMFSNSYPSFSGDYPGQIFDKQRTTSKSIDPNTENN